MITGTVDMDGVVDEDEQVIELAASVPCDNNYVTTPAYYCYLLVSSARSPRNAYCSLASPEMSASCVWPHSHC